MAVVVRGASGWWVSIAGFGRYFWQPRRAHGEIIEQREVSFLELFYDLVHVVVISRAAHHFSSLDQRGLLHDLHGRAEGRTYTYLGLAPNGDPRVVGSHRGRSNRRRRTSDRRRLQHQSHSARLTLVLGTPPRRPVIRSVTTP